MKVEYQREKKKDFQRQMFEIARDEAVMQISNLMLILYERKTMIELVVISNYKNELPFE